MRWIAAAALVLAAACSKSSGSDAPTVELGVGSFWQGAWQSHLFPFPGGVATLTVTAESGGQVEGTLTLDDRTCLPRNSQLAATVGGSRLVGTLAGLRLDFTATVTGNRIEATYEPAPGFLPSQCIDLGGFSLVRVKPARSRSWRISEPVEGVVLVEARDG